MLSKLEVILGAVLPLFPLRMQTLHDTHSGKWSSLVLLAKEHCLSEGEVISSASGVDGWSLGHFYSLSSSSTWMKRRLRNGEEWRGGAQGGKLHMVAIDQFSILPALLVPKEGLSEAVVWGRLGWVLCYIGGTTRPVIAGEKKICKIYDSNQSGLALMYSTSSNFFFCLVQSKLSCG